MATLRQRTHPHSTSPAPNLASPPVSSFTSQVDAAGPWAPPPFSAFCALFAVRLVSALSTNVGDCDETFNYWEPTHFLLYGHGFQTWEYSPVYGLRSYAYILPHALVGYMASFVTENKIHVFVAIRCFLAFVSALIETYLYYATCVRLGTSVGRFLLLFLGFAPGLLVASVAFLPSSFAMYCLTIAMAAWLEGRHWLVVFAAAASALVGWPFCVVVALPPALYLLFVEGPVRCIVWGLAAAALCLIPQILIDYIFFRRWLCAIGNIVLYNVFQKGGGPELYGVEPWSFYVLNGLVNFNIIFLLAMLAPVVILALKRSASCWRVLMYLSPLFLWFVFMSSLKHKEERFLYVIYPMICLGGAYTMHTILDAWDSVWQPHPRPAKGKELTHMMKKKKRHWTTTVLILGMCFLFIALSMSRIYGLKSFYSAPMKIYDHLYHVELEDGKASRWTGKEEVNICVGKEWYRFPSSFFLPSRRFRLRFIRSGFNGLLPKPYEEHDQATSIVPDAMNDRNLEEVSRYTNISACDYLIEQYFPGQVEPHYAEWPEWEVLTQYPFLNAPHSLSPYRTFYIPFLSPEFNVYSPYSLLRRRTSEGRV